MNAMNDDELKVQFSQAAATAINDTDIMNAAATLPDGAVMRIADFIAAYCRIKGIDPQGETLQEFYRQTTEYKALRETQEKLTVMERVFAELESVTEEFRDNKNRGAIPTQEQIDVITDRIKKQAATLGTYQEKSRVYTVADYLNECLSYDPSKDFTPALFGELSFPDGTISYIGARTSRGKTTAMVNLAREAITVAQPKKTIFITLEMSGKQIFNKLILSTAFFLSISENVKKTSSSQSELSSTDITPRKDIYTVWKEGALIGESSKAFRYYATAARDKIKDAIDNGSFILYDGRGATETEIINFMTAHGERGTVILLDYIQKMPAKTGANLDSFRRVQAISYDVANAAADTNSVIIAGAQFNRLGGTDSLGDVFTDESFRECGDLEQDAHNALGIGWKTDKQGRFYEVLKTREDKKQGTLYDLDFVGDYSYMTKADQIYRQENGSKRDKTKSEEENQRSKPVREGYI